MNAAVPDPPRPICRSCGIVARRSYTRYGIRDACTACGLWSWNGKQLVGAEIHAARQRCHDLFDRLWRNAPSIYAIEEPEGTREHRRAVKHIMGNARDRSYLYMAWRLGLPEPEVHMSRQTHLDILHRIEALAAQMTAEVVREWAKMYGVDSPSAKKPCSCGSGEKSRLCPCGSFLRGIGSNQGK